MSFSEKTFAAIHYAAEETYRSAAYRFDNAQRGDSDFVAIQRTLEGAAYFEDGGGPRQLVPPGHAILFSHAEKSQYGYPPGATAPYRLRFLSLSPGALRSLFDRVRRDFGSVVRMPEESAAAALLDEAVRRFAQRNFSDRFQESEFIYRLLIAIYREQVDRTRTTNPIDFGFHYIRNRYRLPIGLKEVARQCGISREYFIRSFKTRYGESPGMMLRRLRLEHAMMVLRTTPLTVEAVAIASGFTSANAFRRLYRRTFNRLPRAKAKSATA